jgi:hypothetical protein
MAEVNGHASQSASTERIQIVDDEKTFTYVHPLALVYHLLTLLCYATGPS